MLIVFTAAQKGSIPPTPSIHRLPRGLPGYLILFAPHAFAPQRQFQSRKPPSPLVFLPISTHFTATPVIPLSSPALQPTSIRSTSHLESRTFTSDLAGRLRALTPNHSGQRSPPTYYRGCWHVVSRGLLLWYRHFLRPIGQRFTSRNPSSLTRRCWVRLSPIAQYSPLLPPVGVWTVSQFQCGRSPSQVGYRSSPWWAVISPTS